MLMEATCECGWQVRGTEEEVVAQVQEHGKTQHGLTVTREEVLAITREVEAKPSDGR